MVEIITASEKDIPIIENILIDAVHWLDSIGKLLKRYSGEMLDLV